MPDLDTPIRSARRAVNLWHRHPGVRTGDKLTTGERAAHGVRNRTGSWPFVFAVLGFLAI